MVNSLVFIYYTFGIDIPDQVGDDENDQVGDDEKREACSLPVYYNVSRICQI